MCGRYTLTKPPKEVAKRFLLDLDDCLSFPSPVTTFNAAPSQQLAVISNDAPDKLSFYRWGLIPAWATDKAIGNKLINARSETLEEKNTYRNLIARRRCLIPADGFYEWKKGPENQPYRITKADEELFAFAGLWDAWADKETGEEIRTFTIITTDAAQELKQLHSRMPVVLPNIKEEQWLNQKLTIEEVMQMLQGPHPKMHSYPVTKAVGSAAENSPELIAPCAVVGTGNLFD